jgi:beta-phosphoglucomutase-like phosphatase (HAD superfamily)
VIEAVIFDMDGLLVDSELYWERARVEVAIEHDKSWTETDQRAMMGVSSREWAEYMIRRLELDMSIPEIQEVIVTKMAGYYAERLPFLPGALDAVRLAGQHWRTALASGSHQDLIEIVTRHPGLNGRFDLIVSGDEVPAGKPAPDIYLETARRLGVEPRHAVCLEDSANGILAGKRAGMRVIAVPSREYPPPAEVLSEADCVLGSLLEFSQALIDRISSPAPAS